MVKFRLSAKENNEYVDLFPRFSIEGIANSENFRGVQVLEVDIPVTNSTTQTITIQTNNRIVDAPFEVHFVSGDKNDYNTINQAQVTANTLTLTRLYNMPKGQIKIALVFYTMGVN
ncbi:MAG TPA: hypothetical protein DCW90_19745 [Lachnospiraceae bacterium]|nr:hypothetical protein [Lachnospiraceae bacterium]